MRRVGSFYQLLSMVLSSESLGWGHDAKQSEWGEGWGAVSPRIWRQVLRVMLCSIEKCRSFTWLTYISLRSILSLFAGKQTPGRNHEDPDPGLTAI